MRPKVSDLNDPSRNCPQQSWRWGELPSPPVTSNRTSPPKSVSGSASREISPLDRNNKVDVDESAKKETLVGTENNGRQSQTTAEGTSITN